MHEFKVIAAIDLLGGEVVRLFQGDFEKVRRYGDPMAAIERWQIPMGETIHLVDLEASRQGKPQEVSTVASLARLGYQTQVGGGVRTIDDAKLWFDAGAARVVMGTVAAQSPIKLRRIADAVGAERILPAIDIRDGMVRVSGWETTSSRSVPMVLETLADIGFSEVLVTDISRDGTLLGPSFELYRDLESMTDLTIIGSGGVGTLSDIGSLARLGNVRGVVVGRALHDRTFSWAEANARASSAASHAPRLLSKINLTEGRVTQSIDVDYVRNPGDPVEVARRLEGEGADGFYLIDDSASEAGRDASRDAIGRVASAVKVPTAAGGGIGCENDIRKIIDSGVGKILLGDLSLDKPEMVLALATEFGVDMFIGEIAARRSGSVGCRVVKQHDASDTVNELGAWAARLEALGVAEIVVSDTGEASMLTAITRKVIESVRIPVVAAPSSYSADGVRELIESGGASGVLVDSRVPGASLGITEVKRFLTVSGIPVRGQMS